MSGFNRNLNPFAALESEEIESEEEETPSAAVSPTGASDPAVSPTGASDPAVSPTGASDPADGRLVLVEGRLVRASLIRAFDNIQRSMVVEVRKKAQSNLNQYEIFSILEKKCGMDVGKAVAYIDGYVAVERRRHGAMRGRGCGGKGSKYSANQYKGKSGPLIVGAVQPPAVVASTTSPIQIFPSSSDQHQISVTGVESNQLSEPTQEILTSEAPVQSTELGQSVIIPEGFPLYLSEALPVGFGHFTLEEEPQVVSENNTSPTPESSPANNMAGNSSNKSVALTEHGGHLDHAHSSEGISITCNDSADELPKQESEGSAGLIPAPDQAISSNSCQNLAPQGKQRKSRQNLTRQQKKAANKAPQKGGKAARKK